MVNRLVIVGLRGHRELQLPSRPREVALCHTSPGWSGTWSARTGHISFSPRSKSPVHSPPAQHMTAHPSPSQPLSEGPSSPVRASVNVRMQEIKKIYFPGYVSGLSVPISLSGREVVGRICANVVFSLSGHVFRFRRLASLRLSYYLISLQCF